MRDTSDPTHITFDWGQIVLDYAMDNGVDTIDIVDPWTEYDNITPLLYQHHPDIFVYTGHGCKNYLATPKGCSITNSWNEPICEYQCVRNSNLKSLRGSIVVTFSCHSASQLGKCAIKYGARAYIGFSDFLMFTSDEFGSQDLFRDALLPMALRLIDGKSVGEAVAATKYALYSSAKHYKRIKYLSIPFLWDYEYMQVQGDMNAKLGG